MNIYQAAKAGIAKVRKPEWEAGHFVDLRVDPETRMPNKWVHIHTPALPGHYGIDGYVDTVHAASFANDYDFVNADEQTPVVGQRVRFIRGLWKGKTGTYAGFYKNDPGLNHAPLYKVFLDNDPVDYCLIENFSCITAIP